MGSDLYTAQILLKLSELMVPMKKIPIALQAHQQSEPYHGALYFEDQLVLVDIVFRDVVGHVIDCAEGHRQGGFEQRTDEP